MTIHIIREKIDKDQIVQYANENYGDMIKGVVDIDQSIIALGGELHADAESVLLDHGSKQEHLWGFNIYPGKSLDDRIEYTSFINIRPKQNNRNILIEDESLRQTIKHIVDQLIES